MRSSVPSGISGDGEAAAGEDEARRPGERGAPGVLMCRSLVRPGWLRPRTPSPRPCRRRARGRPRCPGGWRGRCRGGTAGRPGCRESVSSGVLMASPSWGRWSVTLPYPAVAGKVPRCCIRSRSVGTSTSRRGRLAATSTASSRGPGTPSRTPCEGVPGPRASVRHRRGYRPRMSDLTCLVLNCTLKSSPDAVERPAARLAGPRGVRRPRGGRLDRAGRRPRRPLRRHAPTRATVTGGRRCAGRCSPPRSSCSCPDLDGPAVLRREDGARAPRRRALRDRRRGPPAHLRQGRRRGRRRQRGRRPPHQRRGLPGPQRRRLHPARRRP